jgi:uncharacterized membrane protein YphA (DoxX/SURF4 family)
MESLTYQLKIGQLQNLLKITFGLVPIAAGADKFLNLLTQWDQYVHPAVADLLPFSAGTFMMIVGVIEIAAGILVLIRPRLGAYVVAAWLLLIALSLLFSGQHLDVAVRDIVMAIGALVLAQLSVIQAPKKQKAI